jgi:hypothetical protein
MDWPCELPVDFLDDISWFPGAGAGPTMVSVFNDHTSDESAAAQRNSIPNEDDLIPCPVADCHRFYLRKADVKRHLRMKHPERPDLARAVSGTHVSKEGKPFCCPFTDCPSGYSRRHDLKCHVENKHRGQSVTS